MKSKINFSLTQLEYVMAVHKHGHFIKAAESCFVTQPTLSMQIQKLEEELGVVLFDRSKKPILLTEAGQKLITQFQLVLFEAKKIEDLLRDNSKLETHGELTIGIIPTVAPYVLPNLLSVLAKKFPKLQLNIKELQTHQIIDALDSDEIDAGVLATPLNIPKIFELSIFFEPFHVLCNRKHDLAASKRLKHNSLKSDDLWLLQEGHCLRAQIIDICKIRSEKKDHRKFVFESGSLETLKSLVDSYGGYTLLPHLATKNIGENSVLIPFERPIPAREIGVVYRREHYKSRLIDALADSIRESVPEEIRKLKQKDLEVLPVE